MAQVLFASDTTPALADLDANFTECYKLVNATTVDGSNNVDFTGFVRSATQLLVARDVDALATLANLANTNAGSASQVLSTLSSDQGSLQFGVNSSTFPPNASYGTATEAFIRSASSSTGLFIQAGAVGATIRFACAGNERIVLETAGVFRPSGDNTQTLGSASKRWSTVYAGTGTINTSDARAKGGIDRLTDDELAAAKQLASEIGSFQFLAAIAEKGAAGARVHIGLTVQRAIEILQANGLDAMRYGFICHDTWPEQTIVHPAVTVERVTSVLDASGEPLIEVTVVEPSYVEIVPAGDRYGFRADELLLFVARGFEARLAALEAAS